MPPLTYPRFAAGSRALLQSEHPTSFGEPGALQTDDSRKADANQKLLSSQTPNIWWGLKIARSSAASLQTAQTPLQGAGPEMLFYCPKITLQEQVFGPLSNTLPACTALVQLFKEGAGGSRLVCSAVMKNNVSFLVHSEDRGLLPAPGTPFSWQMEPGKHSINMKQVPETGMDT